MLSHVKVAAMWSVLVLLLAGCVQNSQSDLSLLLKIMMVVAFVFAIFSLGVAIFTNQTERRYAAGVSAAATALIGMLFLIILIA